MHAAAGGPGAPRRSLGHCHRASQLASKPAGLEKARAPGHRTETKHQTPPCRACSQGAGGIRLFKYMKGSGQGAWEVVSTNAELDLYDENEDAASKAPSWHLTVEGGQVRRGSVRGEQVRVLASGRRMWRSCTRKRSQGAPRSRSSLAAGRRPAAQPVPTPRFKEGRQAGSSCGPLPSPFLPTEGTSRSQPQTLACPLPSARCRSPLAP